MNIKAFFVKCKFSFVQKRFLLYNMIASAENEDQLAKGLL